jgi:hypothetical protein
MQKYSEYLKNKKKEVQVYLKSKDETEITVDFTVNIHSLVDLPEEYKGWTIFVECQRG